MSEGQAWPCECDAPMVNSVTTADGRVRHLVIPLDADPDQLGHAHAAMLDGGQVVAWVVSCIECGRHLVWGTGGAAPPIL